jgi:helicase
MSNIDRIINSIKAVLNASEENLSSLSAMLNDIDANHIYNKFKSISKENINIYSKDELLSKTNLLNALMEIILENPSMEEISSSERKKLLSDLYKTTASLYEQLLEQNNENVLENLSYLVMYSMLSYLAGKQTISNIVIEEYNRKLLDNEDILSNMNIMSQLEVHTYYLIVLMVSNIKNYNGLVLVMIIVQQMIDTFSMVL